jgi:hypothetical protein
MRERRGRHRQERCCCGTLELPAAHFAAELVVNPVAAVACVDMGSRLPRVVVARLACSPGGNRVVAVIAHAACRRDHRDPVQLRVRATSRRAHLTERETQMPGGRHGAHPVDSHHSHDLALTRIEISHQISSPGKAIAELQLVEWVGNIGCGVLNRCVELDPLARAQPREVPAFAVPAATMIDRKPERTQQVMLIGDTARRHHDRRDRVVNDLLLRRQRYPA